MGVPKGVPRVVYLAICLPTVLPGYVHPVYHPVHSRVHRHPACPLPVIAVLGVTLPDDDALGSKRENVVGMRRILASLSLMCEVWYTSAHRILPLPVRITDKDWIDEGVPYCITLG